MRLLKLGLLLLLISALIGCETLTTNNAPPVTAKMTSSRNVNVLNDGRQLFVNRCIDCHSLPVIAEHSSSEWPGLVDKMSGRAHLKPGQQDAIVAYILAVKSSKD